MSFSAQIKGFAQRTKTSIAASSKGIKISLFNGVINDTRVLTGMLRGNWQTSTGSPITSEIDRLDPNGEATKQEVKKNVTAYGVDYMSNNLPYAEVYEEKDAMIGKNMMRISRIVKEVVRG